jgi:UDP-N-acetylglucosamine 2-epimerase (non-hydrolysing)
MRRSTDRPEALRAGGVTMVGTDAVTIVSAAKRLLTDEGAYDRMASAPNPFGDGRASERIAELLEAQFRSGWLSRPQNPA